MTYIGCGVMFLYWKMYRGFFCSKVLIDDSGVGSCDCVGFAGTLC